METLVLRGVLAECRSLLGPAVTGITGSAGAACWSVGFGPAGQLVIGLGGTSPSLFGRGVGRAAGGGALPPEGGSLPMGSGALPPGGAALPPGKASAAPFGPGPRRGRPARSQSGLSGLLEERLTGARAIRFDTWGLSRVAILSFEGRDRYGDPAPATLVVEILGSWGNLILLDGPPPEGRIVDRLRGDHRRSGGRALERGKVYTFPERERADLILDGPEALEVRLVAPPLPLDPAGWARRFAASAEGAGAAVARDVVALTPGPLDARRLVATWASLVERSDSPDGAWLSETPGALPRVTLYMPPARAEEEVAASAAAERRERPGPGVPSQPSPSDELVPERAVKKITSDEPARRFESVSAAVEAQLAAVAGASAGIAGTASAGVQGSGSAATERQLAARRVKTSRLLARLTVELARRPDGELDRLRAETLLARAGQVERGLDRVRLEAPHGGQVLDIPLDPLLGVAENARRYFREARKAELARKALPDRIERARRELEKIDSEGAAAHGRAAAHGTAQPDGRNREGRGASREKTPASLEPRRYNLVGGWTILVGRSQVGNDYLTHRLAAPHDLWFHVHGASGSHVVLKAPDRKAVPDKAVLLAAAALAALNSKARHASRVPVIYAEKRHVRKPRGSKPGLAAVTGEKSIMVKPGEPPACLKEGAA